MDKQYGARVGAWAIARDLAEETRLAEKGILAKGGFLHLHQERDADGGCSWCGAGGPNRPRWIRGHDASDCHLRRETEFEQYQIAQAEMVPLEVVRAWIIPLERTYKANVVATNRFGLEISKRTFRYLDHERYPDGRCAFCGVGGPKRLGGEDGHGASTCERRATSEAGLYAEHQRRSAKPPMGEKKAQVHALSA